MPFEDENVELPSYMFELIDPDQFMRWAAAERANAHTEDILQYLIPLLNVKEMLAGVGGILDTIAHALRNVGVAAIPVLLRALQDTRPRVRRHAALLLGYDKVSIPFKDGSYNFLDTQPVGSFDGRPVVEALTLALREDHERIIHTVLDDHERVIHIALGALGRLAHSNGADFHAGTLAAVIDLFKSRDEDVRSSALTAIHDILHAKRCGAPIPDYTGVFAPLLGLLKDPYPSVRYSVIRALDHTMDMQFFDAVAQALSDENRDVRYIAIHVLVDLAKEQAVPTLLQTLEREYDPSTRIDILDGLSEIDFLSDSGLKTSYALEPSLRLLRDPNADVREFAALLLSFEQGSHDRIIPALTEAYNREQIAETRECIAKALEKLRRGAEP